MKLKCKLYTIDAQEAGREGVLTPDGRAQARSVSEITGVYHDPSNANYRKAIAARPDKTQLTAGLMQTIRFENLRSIGEVGGAPYIQAHQIVTAHPHLDYIATDQDSLSNAVLAQVPMLSRLEIKTFNVRADDFCLFDDCDVLISFGVDYALSEQDLMNVFEYLRAKKRRGSYSASA